MANEVTRRTLLRTVALSLAAAPIAELLGCAGGASGAVAAPGGGASGTGWATGGTAVMKGGYADPFLARGASASASASACKLTCSATVGPCYAQTLVRKDISEGHGGLPVRLAFLVVDASCTPIPNAEVDIWHAAPEGFYSGADTQPMCTGRDAKALAARWFRGKQTTDAKGRVDFDTCFPGWYRGRTIHVHFTVRVSGAAYVTSQLVFDDALVDTIVATQAGYSERGARDTTNENDGVLAASEVADYTFETARQADGAMLAWKTLVLHAAGASTCATTGGGFPGGPPPGSGAPPGGGAPPGALTPNGASRPATSPR